MGTLARTLAAMDFWRLHPEPKLVTTQPGDSTPRRYVAAAGTDNKDLTLVYVPEDRTLEIALDGLPASPSVNWLNPRTGQTSPAVAVVVGNVCQFPTAEPGDWLLVMKAGK